jgi:hypothetical protein
MEAATLIINPIHNVLIKIKAKLHSHLPGLVAENISSLLNILIIQVGIFSLLGQAHQIVKIHQKMKNKIHHHREEVELQALLHLNLTA